MTFKDFNIRITRDPILGKLLPLQLRRTFPWFRVEGTGPVRLFRRVPDCPGGDGGKGV